VYYDELWPVMQDLHRDFTEHAMVRAREGGRELEGS
jgi:hypothetical protein